VVSSPSQGGKDRKKSAHWTDNDTDTLIGVLLRHRDSGRTSDNGFKPEVWDEASALLERAHYLGGSKTPDACKSRWQRLQRDYKFARQLQSYPNIAWDRNEHRLVGNEAAWEAAEYQVGSSETFWPCMADVCVRSTPKQENIERSTSLATDNSRFCARTMGCDPALARQSLACRPHRSPPIHLASCH
jgi:hypothetical protein